MFVNYIFSFFFSLNLQRTFAIYSVVTRKLNDMYRDLILLPYRPTTKGSSVSSSCLSSDQQMCFFQILRPTQSHSQTPYKTITEFSSRRGGELVKIMNKQSGLAERGARTRSAFSTFAVTETELWTASKAEQPFVLGGNCSICAFQLSSSKVVESLWIFPKTFPKTECLFLSASGSYWRRKQHQPRCPGIRQRTK